jgi:site-specific recombinase XerD
MPIKMGRPRERNKDLPPGIRLINGRYYWKPTSAAERAARKAKGLKATVPLGSDPMEMRRAWVRLNPPDGAPAESTVAYLIERYREEEVDRVDPRTRQPKRTEKTRDEYRRQLGKWEERIGRMRYARNAVEASAGDCFRRMHVVQFLRNSKTPTQANKDVSVLSQVFEYARDVGLTEYNPCAGAERNTELPRDREALAWEVEALLAAAPPLLALMIRFVRITGWRGAEIRSLEHRQLEPGGIRLQRAKGGKRELWEWTPELRAIVEEAKTLRGAVRSLHYVFCTRKGSQLTEWGLQSLWRATLRRANRQLADAGVAITGLTFHDLRSKAIDDAAERGRDPVAFASHTDGKVTQRHYLRRAKRQTPLD